MPDYEKYGHKIIGGRKRVIYTKGDAELYVKTGGRMMNIARYEKKVNKQSKTQDAGAASNRQWRNILGLFVRGQDGLYIRNGEEGRKYNFKKEYKSNIEWAQTMEPLKNYLTTIKTELNNQPPNMVIIANNMSSALMKYKEFIDKFYFKPVYLKSIRSWCDKTSKCILKLKEPSLATIKKCFDRNFVTSMANHEDKISSVILEMYKTLP